MGVVAHSAPAGRVGVTLGDPAGIGPEIVAAALAGLTAPWRNGSSCSAIAGLSNAARERSASRCRRSKS